MSGTTASSGIGAEVDAREDHDAALCKQRFESLQRFHDRVARSDARDTGAHGASSMPQCITQT
ncbi:MAG TPA: hypothetical protein VE819_07255 [Steroidobacteraceae bacterium]|jgi:hypothetical protein|nr:hypothetical protein [Steroidobacteraceae bacterium]